MFFLVLLTTLFFLPTIIAVSRDHNGAAIFLLNFFFGWTVIGWWAALIWALTDRRYDRYRYVYL